MSVEGDGVATARWLHEASKAVALVVRQEVTGFARRHGMAAAIAEDVGIAICEAVPYAADSTGSDSPVVVEAATDGEWFSVRIDGDAERSGSRADVVLELPLGMTLAHRFEYGTRWRGTGTSVLMEFPMGARRGAGAACAGEQRHRRATSVRRGTQLGRRRGRDSNPR